MLLFVTLIVSGCWNQGLPEVSRPEREITFQPIQQTAKDRAMLALPVVTENLVICGDEFGKVQCQNLADASPVWEKDLGQQLAYHHPAVVGNQVVLVGNRYAGFMGLSLKDGSLTWNVPADGLAGTLEDRWVDGTRVVSWASAKEGENRIFRAFALDARNGTILWRRNGKPCAARDGITIVNDAKTWIALSTETGKELWSKPESVGDRQPQIQSGTVLFCDMPGSHLTLCRASDGTVLWSADSPLRGIMLGSPLVLDGVVYWYHVGDKAVIAQDSPRGQRWKTPLNLDAASANHAALFSRDDNLLVVLDVGNVQTLVACLERSSGRLLWRTRVTGELTGFGTACQGGFSKGLFVAGNRRFKMVYGFDLGSGNAAWYARLGDMVRSGKAREESWILADGSLVMIPDRRHLLQAKFP